MKKYFIHTDLDTSKYIISGIKCSCLQLQSDQRPHGMNEGINEGMSGKECMTASEGMSGNEGNDGMNGNENKEINENGEEYEEDFEEENEDEERIIPMLCYGLILLFLTTLLTGSFILPFAQTQEFADMTKKIFVAILLGEMFGVLLSILCVMLYCACDASAASYLYKQISGFRFSLRIEKDVGGHKENANKLKIV